MECFKINCRTIYDCNGVFRHVVTEMLSCDLSNYHRKPVQKTCIKPIENKSYLRLAKHEKPTPKTCVEFIETYR